MATLRRPAMIFGPDRVLTLGFLFLVERVADPVLARRACEDQDQPPAPRFRRLPIRRQCDNARRSDHAPASSANDQYHAELDRGARPRCHEGGLARTTAAGLAPRQTRASGACSIHGKRASRSGHPRRVRVLPQASFHSRVVAESGRSGSLIESAGSASDQAESCLGVLLSRGDRFS
jgi:hypothetical protein